MKIRIVLVVASLIISLIVTILLYIENDNYYELKGDFDNGEAELSNLVKEFKDSTHQISKYYSSEEFDQYVRNIKEDSLRNFLLNQKLQFDYFFYNQQALRIQIKTLNISLNNSRNFLYYSLILLVLMTILNLYFLINFLRKRRNPSVEETTHKAK